MLNTTQKENIINFLTNNTPTAAAYYIRMTAMKQHSRMSPILYELCQVILSEFDNTSANLEFPNTVGNGVDLKEDKSYKTIITDATFKLIGDTSPNRLTILIDTLMKKIFKEKKPNMEHSGIQKQYFNHTAQIFMNHYAKKPSVVAAYTKIALKDFPGLKDSDIDIIVFGGQSKKGHMGIRFQIPKTTTPPSDYFEWSSPDNLDELIY